MRTIYYAQAINEALTEEMARDETVLVLGQSVQSGMLPATKGLLKRFGPQRVVDTPLSEHAECGAGIGLAAAGFRPVVDLVEASMMLSCTDELFGVAPIWYHSHAVPLPLVFVGMMSQYNGHGPLHSRSTTAMALQSIGMKVVIPSNAYDAKGLFKTAIRDNNPVAVMFPGVCLGTQGDVPEEEYTIPFGVADVKRQGTDVTVVAIGAATNLALQAADQLQARISVEVVDPRTLEPLDIDTILASVRKTGRVVIVDVGARRCGVAAEIGMQIVENAFHSLAAPIRRADSLNYPIPALPDGEQYVLPSVESIITAIEEVAP